MFAKRLRATARLVVVVVIGAAACAPVSKLPDISPEAAKREREIQNEMAFRQLYKNTQRVHLIAYPILKKYEVPFTVYVATSFADRVGELWWLALEAVVRKTR